MTLMCGNSMSSGFSSAVPPAVPHALGQQNELAVQVNTMQTNVVTRGRGSTQKVVSKTNANVEGEQAGHAGELVPNKQTARVGGKPMPETMLSPLPESFTNSTNQDTSGAGRVGFDVPLEAQTTRDDGH